MRTIDISCHSDSQLREGISEGTIREFKLGCKGLKGENLKEQVLPVDNEVDEIVQIG